MNIEHKELLQKLSQQKQILFTQKKWREAIIVLERMIQLQASAELFNQKGFVFLQLRDLSQAQANFIEAFKLDPNNVQTQRALMQIKKLTEKTNPSVDRPRDTTGFPKQHVLKCRIALLEMFLLQK